jgi:hypothetical protein
LAESWGDLYDGGQSGGNRRLCPFFTVRDADDEVLLQWLNDTRDVLSDEHADRAQRMMRYVDFVNAIHDDTAMEQRSITDAQGRPMGRMAYLMMNHARDFITQKVARLLKFDPKIDVLPTKSAYSDRMGALQAKRVINNAFYLNSIRAVSENVVRTAATCGEAYIFPRYDMGKGNLHPKYLRYLAEQEMARQAGLAIPDMPSQVLTTADGREVDLWLVQKTGEIVYDTVLPWFVLCEPAFSWEAVNYVFRLNVKHIDQIKAENPGVDIEATSRDFSSSMIPGFEFGDWALEAEFFHRATEFCPSGAHIKFVEGAILYRGPIPTRTGDLPVVRLTDYDHPANAHGMSFLDDIAPPLIIFNRLMNSAWRAIALTAAPKLLAPRGSNYEAMINGQRGAVVEYDPPFKPEWASFEGVTPETLNFADRLMTQTQQLSGTFGVSRGEIIPNARATGILNFYQEQEQEREAPVVAKFNTFLEHLGHHTLDLAARYYKDDDGRTIRVVGERGVLHFRKLKHAERLSYPYDLTIERNTQLAESKQGRVDQIVALGGVPVQQPDGTAMPGLFTREQILAMLEIGDTEGFFDSMTASEQAAQLENEMLFEGEEVPPPEPWEHLLIHWNVHFLDLQNPEYKLLEDVPPEVIANKIKHMLMTETIMYDKAMISAAFAQTLSMNPHFPAVLQIGDTFTINQIAQIHASGQSPMMQLQAMTMPPEMAAPPEGEGITDE